MVLYDRNNPRFLGLATTSRQMYTQLKTSLSSCAHPDYTNRTIHRTRNVNAREQRLELSDFEAYIPQYPTTPHCQQRSTRLDRSDTSAYSALGTLRTSGRTQSNRGGRLLSMGGGRC